MMNENPIAFELLGRDKVNRTPNAELSMIEVVTITNYAICHYGTKC